MLDELFDNIGGKIKGLAKILFVIEAIGSILGGLAYIILGFSDSDTILWGFGMGIAVAVGGVLTAWVSSWFMYGFGELIEKICNISNKIDVLAKPVIEEARDKKDQAFREAVAARKSKEEERREKERLARIGAVNTQPTPEATQKTQPQESTMSTKEHLEYALKFETDYGMIAYLKSVKNDKIQEIVNRPDEEIRTAVEELLETL